MELLNFSEEKLIFLLQAMNNFDEINYFCKNSESGSFCVFFFPVRHPF